MIRREIADLKEAVEEAWGDELTIRVSRSRALVRLRRRPHVWFAVSLRRVAGGEVGCMAMHHPAEQTPTRAETATLESACCYCVAEAGRAVLRLTGMIAAMPVEQGAAQSRTLH